MVEAGNGAGFAFESLANFGSVGQPLWENFDGDSAVKARVACAVHFAHAAGAERRLNFVRAEFRSGGEGHRRAL